MILATMMMYHGDDGLMMMVMMILLWFADGGDDDLMMRWWWFEDVDDLMTMTIPGTQAPTLQAQLEAALSQFPKSRQIFARCFYICQVFLSYLPGVLYQTISGQDFI